MVFQRPVWTQYRPQGKRKTGFPAAIGSCPSKSPLTVLHDMAGHTHEQFGRGRGADKTLQCRWMGKIRVNTDCTLKAASNFDPSRQSHGTELFGYARS